MTLKTKLSLGLGFLFLIIFILAAFGSYCVEKLAQESDNILKDNYDSIVYSKNMSSALDDMGISIGSTMSTPGATGTVSDNYPQLFESGRNVFESNLKAESNNITEIHEKEHVEQLAHDYQLYLKLCLRIKNGLAGSSVYIDEFLPACKKMKQSVDGIYDINMQAVVRKNQLVKRDAAGFITSMAVMGALCILLAFGYFWYFPFYISCTMSYLSNRMRDLLKNIGVVFDVKTNDEADIIMHAINLFENKFGVKNEDRRKE
jgi:two-component system, NtrC family, sensor histidine kinase KinB